LGGEKEQKKEGREGHNYREGRQAKILKKYTKKGNSLLKGKEHGPSIKKRRTNSEKL